MVVEWIQAFIIIFIAELGDKSQILAMTFATKFKFRFVIIGVFLGILFNHGVAVLFGSQLHHLFGPLQLNLFSGLIFLLFGYWSLFEKAEHRTNKLQRWGPVATIAIAFFFSELGDKTQFATIALSSSSTYPWLILTATVSAMMATSVIGIVIGAKLGNNVPDFYLRVVSATLFVSFGAYKLSDSTMMFAFSDIALIIIFGLMLVLYIFLIRNRVRDYMNHPLTAFKIAAQRLHEYYNNMIGKLDVICLGEDVCGVCKEKQCLIGHTKYLLEEARHGRSIDPSYLESPVAREVDPQKVHDALLLTIAELKDHWDDEGYLVVHLIRKNLEQLLFKKESECSNYSEYVLWMQSQLGR